MNVFKGVEFLVLGASYTGLFRCDVGCVGFVNYVGQCIIYNKDIGRVESWFPSVSDMFAVDWEYTW